MTEVVDEVGGSGAEHPAGWYPDPLAPFFEATRERWWNGARWTARVHNPAASTEAAEPAASGGFLSELPEGIAWIPWLYRLAPPPIAPVAIESAIAPVPTDATVPMPAVPFDADPMVIAFGRVDSPAAPLPDAPKAPSPAESRTAPVRRGRRRIEVLAFAAALVLLVGGAIAGADIVSGGGEQRPSLNSAVTYRDSDAGFTLQYPESWRVIERDHGTGIRFAIGAPGAPTTETNTVSVNVGDTAAALPELHTLADQLTEKLRQELPAVRLQEAGRTHLAGAPGLRFTFIDPTVPETRIDQYVGRTTAGRPLTVTVTEREPRTAPSPASVQQFLDSVQAT